MKEHKKYGTEEGNEKLLFQNCQKSKIWVVPANNKTDF